MEYTKCKYEGEVIHGRMESKNGTFLFSPETGMKYQGEMKDGMFHGKGVITLKNGARIEGEWKFGLLVSRQYIYSDGLEFNEQVDEWDYCQAGNKPDRRFYEERINEKKQVSNLEEDWGSKTSESGVQPAIPDERQIDTLSDELHRKHNIAM